MVAEFFAMKTGDKVLTMVLLAMLISFLFILWEKFMRRGGRLKIGNVEISPNDPDHHAQKPNCLDCARTPNVLLLMEISSNYQAERERRIRDYFDLRQDKRDKYSIVSEQLSYARMILDTVIAKWHEDISDLEFPMKRVFLDNAKNRVIAKFLEALQENHFDEMTDLQSHERAKKRAENIAEDIFCGTMYSKIEEDGRAVLVDAVIDMIENARRVILKRNREITDMETELEKELESSRLNYETRKKQVLRGEYVGTL